MALSENVKLLQSALRTGLQLEKIRFSLESSGDFNQVRRYSGPPSDKDALSLAVEIGLLLDRQNIEYAIGGSLALGVWAVPRATVDIDLNVFIRGDDDVSTAKLMDALECYGAEYLDSHMGKPVSRSDAAKLIKKDDQLYMKMSGRDVDIFLSKTIMEDRSKVRRKPVTIGKDVVFFLDPETLAAFKLMWHRNKDIVDLEQLFSVQGNKLDINYIKTLLELRLNEYDLAFSLLSEMENKFVKSD